MIRYIFILHLLFDNLLEEALAQARRLGRRWWVKEYNLEAVRDNWGAFNRVFMYLKHNDTEQFYEFVRMTPAQFEFLNHLVEPILTKNSWRTPLPPQLRLAVTLQ